MTFQFTDTDAMNSVLSKKAADGQCQRQSFSPYGGNSTALAHTPGFNGERPDPLTGTTHLGNGYRAYNPTLMRFHAPDNMSPFGAGGMNSYAYCSGDPINRSDPSGHMNRLPSEGRGKKRGFVGLLTDVLPGGDMAIAAVRGMGAVIESASTSVSAAAEIIQGTGRAKNLQKVKTDGKFGLAPGNSAKGRKARGSRGVSKYYSEKLEQAAEQWSKPDVRARYGGVFNKFCEKEGVPERSLKRLINAKGQRYVTTRLVDNKDILDWHNMPQSVRQSSNRSLFSRQRGVSPASFGYFVYADGSLTPRGLRRVGSNVAVSIPDPDDYVDMFDMSLLSSTSAPSVPIAVDYQAAIHDFDFDLFK
ncbi:RHS repeat-associated core domain-containing protein [Serratia quinivorans]|uniref:RHS repeat-associated core domain-containing protein n=1 Tax=Serratia quinivorans TaxID=137545 RepID=UPI002179FDD9|nr:RHS repeat-associated core domain-containing protein [Serratia quinivorans]CAI0732571.1 RHS repeat-associated core domain [Serratia quinivorans]CAI1606518.1 RHS repeat-associated core domain [Serratia quinivorans]